MKPSVLQHLDNLITRYPELSILKINILNAADMICESCKSDGKVLVCGNGGSAADSEHIVGELMKGFVLPRKLKQSDIDSIKNAGFSDWKYLADSMQQGIPAIALTEHSALSSAILNDNDPYMAFAQQTYVYGRPGDILIGISTSGNARNVCNALKVGKAFGVKTIGFTGSKPSAMEDICDIMLKVPAQETFKVQEYHLPVYHALCIMIEEEIFGE